MGQQGYVFTSATIVLSTPTLVRKATYFPSVSSSIILAYSRGREASTTTSISLYNFEPGSAPVTLMENTVSMYFQIVGLTGGQVQIEIA
jgi:hypothetical protein